MTARLQDRTAVVTGADSGIGLGIVDRLTGEGARVFVATREPDALGDLLERVGVTGGRAGDLGEPDVAEALVAAAVAAMGHVDVLVNNAGGGVIRPTMEHTEDTLRATIDNNLWTAIRCVRAVLPHMVDRRHGRVINIGADSVRTGLMDHAMYNAAKGGVHAMVTGLAREFADAGITANTVAPCYVRTPQLAELLDSGQAPPRLSEVIAQGTDIVPIGRPGDPSEVAAAVAFLAAEDSRFITGQTIYVNGGASMG
ncbi:SDR family NAD(P)-dependent oxidoreductase [Mycolicibacterium hodleri]|uniref:3-oxoacyl-[acyl-carrier-protein] reductase MabA n=1 Tax=Mycolicibacterium hodleri TaxID=49897 RepID=A0A502EHK0_9MYCO|nr:SDR family oxidoreductase [Mycolicibacterium hodleri]TPG36502.1 SDR family oxidoreductase [Mycolicibacterium hodleri]